jgi:hypothetical protein
LIVIRNSEQVFVVDDFLFDLIEDLDNHFFYGFELSEIDLYGPEDVVSCFLDLSSMQVEQISEMVLVNGFNHFVDDFKLFSADFARKCHLVDELQVRIKFVDELLRFCLLIRTQKVKKCFKRLV